MSISREGISEVKVGSKNEKRKNINYCSMLQ